MGRPLPRAIALILTAPLLAASCVFGTELSPETIAAPGVVQPALSSDSPPAEGERRGLLTGSVPILNHADEPVDGKPVIAAQALDFRKAIRALESEHGAYAGQLSEYLQSLGLDLQRSGMHAEAVEVFKRGVHLARINEGLYSAEQIPLLEKEIDSHIALGEYSVADERQFYLYRVQMRNLDAGPDRAEAFLEQANWQYYAYRLGLERDNFNRLVSIWDLNNLALNDIAKLEGQASVSLLTPLRGMLRAQYLIADYNFNKTEYALTSSDTYAAQAQLNRFNAFRAQNFGKGETVVRSIYEIEVSNHGENSPEAAEAQALQGDWLLYHGQRNAAAEYYQLAVAELAPLDDAETEVERLFGEPVELPDDDVVRLLPPPVPPEQGDLVVQFSVSASGRVTDLERLDDRDLNQGVVNRILRALRGTRFRPRLTSEGPVDTDKVIRAYEIK